MNIEALKRSRQNLSNILNDFGAVSTGTSVRDEQLDSVQDDIPISLFGLGKWPLVKDCHNVKKEIADIRGHDELKPFLKGYESADALASKTIEFSQNIKSCLEYIHSVSQILEQALKDPMKQDALPMPHELHRDAVNMFESCMWLIQNKRWQPTDHRVEWEIIIPKLEEIGSNWETFSKLTGMYLKEVQDLRQKLEIILQNHHSLLAKEIC